MRPQSGNRQLGSVTTTALLALWLGSCGDDAPTSSFSNAGSGGGGTAAVGGFSAGDAGAGVSGSVGAGSDAGGTAGSAGASGGAGGSGGANGGGGNGGSGGAPRVYAILGCDEPGASGAGGEGNAGGSGNAGGEGSVGGDGNVGGDGSVGGDAGVSVGGAGEGGAGPTIPMPGAFASFTVYDFLTDMPVPTCVDRVSDFEITITGDAPLTLAVNLTPGLMPGSVVWTYDGVAQTRQNNFPYALGDDDNGDFHEPTPPLTAGAHVLGITVYAERNAMGAILGEASVTITVVER